MKSIRIESERTGKSTFIYADGRCIPGVIEYALTQKVGEKPRLTLVLWTNDVVVDGEAAVDVKGEGYPWT